MTHIKRFGDEFTKKPATTDLWCNHCGGTIDKGGITYFEGYGIGCHEICFGDMMKNFNRGKE